MAEIVLRRERMFHCLCGRVVQADIFGNASFHMKTCPAFQQRERTWPNDPNPRSVAWNDHIGWWFGDQYLE